MHDATTADVLWWGGASPNNPLDSHVFLTNRERAVDYLNTLDRVYVVDAFVNWDPQVRCCTAPPSISVRWTQRGRCIRQCLHQHAITCLNGGASRRVALKGCAMHSVHAFGQVT